MTDPFGNPEAAIAPRPSRVTYDIVSRQTRWVLHLAAPRAARVTAIWRNEVGLASCTAATSDCRVEGKG